MAHDSSRQEYRERRRAVSPVIGVILMVAISVILAAVIGAFVLEIGNQQETAPNASFSTDERVVTLKSDRQKDHGFSSVSTTMEMNTTQVLIRHAGGDVLRTSRSEIRVNGYRDAWGVTPSPNALEMGAGHADDSVDLAPQPDFRTGLGTNEPTTLGSGESWNVVAYDIHRDVPTGTGPRYPNSTKSLYEPGTRDVNAPEANATHDFIFLQQFDASGSGYQCDCPVVYIYADEQAHDPGWGEVYGWGPQLAEGDDVAVVWTASSGGKTQTLTKYEAQHDPTRDGAFN